MKHKFIVLTLLVTTLFSGCGNQTTEVFAPVESQEEEQPQEQDFQEQEEQPQEQEVQEQPIEETVEVHENWYRDKVFQDEDTGVYCWVDEVKGNLCFLVSMVLDEDAATCVAIVEPNDYTIYDENYIRYDRTTRDGTTIVLYDMNNGDLILLVGTEDGKASYLSGTYKEVTNQPQEQYPTEQPNLSTEFPEYSQWECFETASGEDIQIGIEIQSGDPVMVFPEAQFIFLERADTCWYFLNDDLTDSYEVYTTVSLHDNELIISTPEEWKWDGTYIQLPDLGTDGEN